MKIYILQEIGNKSLYVTPVVGNPQNSDLFLTHFNGIRVKSLSYSALWPGLLLFSGKQGELKELYRSDIL